MRIATSAPLSLMNPLFATKLCHVGKKSPPPGYLMMFPAKCRGDLVDLLVNTFPTTASMTLCQGPFVLYTLVASL